MSKEPVLPIIGYYGKNDNHLEVIAFKENHVLREFDAGEITSQPVCLISDALNVIRLALAQPVQPADLMSELCGPAAFAKLSSLSRAGIAHAAFGNPIPKAAYALIDAVEAHYLKVAQPVQTTVSDALNLAGNRLQRIAMELPHGSGTRAECHDWAHEAFAALAQPVPNLKLDGDQWCATWPGFINLQESLAGFGNTPELAISALKAAIAQPAKGFQCEPQPAVTDDGFCEWVCPKPVGYLMQCCDCGLIHEVETRVAKYTPRPSEEFVVIGDLNLQVQWRMKRRDDLSSEPVAQAEPLSDSIAQPSKGLKLLPIEPGDIVEFQGEVFKVVCYGDRPKTLDLHVHPKTRAGDQWRNVPVADLTHVAGAQE